MPRANSCNSSKRSDPPQISFTSWILGGPLITGSRRSSRGKPAPEPATAKIEPVAAKAEGREEAKTDTAPVAVDKEDVKEKENGNEEKKVEEKTDKGEDKGDVKEKQNSPTISTTVTVTIDKGEKSETEPNETEKTAAVTDPKPDGGHNDSSSEWTAEQDSKILELKALHQSWAEIAAAVDASKSDVKGRYKVLMKAEHSGKNDKNDSNESSETAKEPAAEGPAAEMEQDQQGGDNEDAKEEEKEGGGSVPCGCAAHAAASGGGCQGGNGTKESDAPKRLCPDAMWSRVDCEILEMLHERYRDQQWLIIQSGFYNLTGRMIMGHHIADKLKELG